MKKHVKPMYAALISCSLLLVFLVVLGCSPEDKPKPGARIPNVPPSTRSADPGGPSVPGKAGDVDERSENSLNAANRGFRI